MQQQQQKQAWSLDDKFNTVVALGQFAGAPMRMLLSVSGRMGESAIGAQTFIGIAFGFLFLGSWNPVIALYYFYVVAAAVIAHKLAGRWRPAWTHSHYNGLPWLCLLGVNEKFAKSTLEPVLLFVAGCFAIPIDEGLAYYLWISGVGLVISGAYCNIRDNAVQRAARDAQIEQQLFIERREARRAPRPKAHGYSKLLLLTVLCGGGWLAYSGGIVLPQFQLPLGKRMPTNEEVAREYRRRYPGQRFSFRRLEAVREALSKR